MFAANSKSSIDLGMCQPGTDKYEDEFGNEANVAEINKFMTSTYNIIPQASFLGMGATGCLYHILKALPSDMSVWVDKRYYVDYPGIISKSGHKMEIFNHLRGLDVENSIILVNFPNNPTGLDASDEDVKILEQLSNKNNFIILDSVYARLFPESRRDWQCKINNAVLVDSLSKTNCACGSRIGWASFFNCNPEWLDKYLIDLRSSIRYDYVCPITRPKLAEMLAQKSTDFSENRKLMVSILESHGIKAYTYEPKSLFVLAFIDPTIQSKLSERGVNFVAHNEFGSHDVSEVRLTYAIPLDKLNAFADILDDIMQ